MGGTPNSAWKRDKGRLSRASKFKEDNKGVGWSPRQYSRQREQRMKSLLSLRKQGVPGAKGSSEKLANRDGKWGADSLERHIGGHLTALPWKAPSNCCLRKAIRKDKAIWQLGSLDRGLQLKLNFKAENSFIFTSLSF